jgi:general secretion pathway protein I
MVRVRKPKWHVQGFTLLEVIIAFVIMALILGATFDTFSTGLRQATVTERYAGAVIRAETQLARIGRSEPLVAGIQTGEFDQSYAWQTEVTLLPNENPEEPNEGPLQLYNVVVTVFWGTGDDARDVTLRSQRVGAAVISR